MTALLVGLFGAAGALLRFAADTWLARLQAARRRPEQHWPWATLLVNVTGSFILGLVAGGVVGQEPGLAETWRLAEPWRVALASGLAGGLTTFSSFTVATVKLWAERRAGAAVVNLAANVLLGTAAAALGLAATGLTVPLS